jgi:diguanylate cyclase (GGDEF)-like protein/PAS domain S-box-containing protein
MLTSRNSTEDIVSGLEAGANEYIAKPFDNMELKARLDAGQRMLDLQNRLSEALSQQRLTASVFTHASEGITITDVDGTILEVNNAFSRITGYSREEVLGKSSRILRSGNHGAEFYATMWGELQRCGHWSGEIVNRHKSGELYTEMLTINAVRDQQGVTQYYVALFSDITAQKEHESRLEHIAHYDALTGLPNRVLLADRLHQALNQSQRRGQPVAVAYIDLDGFKLVNDTHGHEVGDRLLMTLAARMKEIMREGDTIARLGGDEFVMVLSDLNDTKDSLPLVLRLLSAAAQPVYYGTRMLQVSASVGLSFYPQSEEVDADQLLRQADQAMYQAKLAGKNRYHIFDTEQDRNVRGHHESLEHIRNALGNNEFVLYYQPKVNMRSGEVTGVEALIRWQHPEQGLLKPYVFLPVVEDNPLSIELGEWTIDTALTQLETWQAAGVNITVSVNVGASQLQQPDFTERLRDLLQAHAAVNPSDLELEVLETSALEDITHVSEVMHACGEMGVHFSLDDFGTGYSSLTYLRRLPATQLKIDQTFVRGMLDDPEDLAILEGVLGLASAFRRQAIAEGVETVEHGQLLLQLGCELGQGYGIARPMLAEDLPDWIDHWRPDPSWTAMHSVSRDDMAVLFASVEHRAWIRIIEEYLKDESPAPPPLDQHQCRFGHWLDREGRARHGTHPRFHSIESLHHQVHILAIELLKTHDQGDQASALMRLSELHGLRDALIEQLTALTQKPS